MLAVMMIVAFSLIVPQAKPSKPSDDLAERAQVLARTCEAAAIHPLRFGYAGRPLLERTPAETPVVILLSQQTVKWQQERQWKTESYVSAFIPSHLKFKSGSGTGPKTVVCIEDMEMGANDNYYSFFLGHPYRKVEAYARVWYVWLVDRPTETIIDTRRFWSEPNAPGYSYDLFGNNRLVGPRPASECARWLLDRLAQR
jgi:hypothetical protein